VENKMGDLKGNLCAMGVLGSALSLCNGFSFLPVRSGCRQEMKAAAYGLAQS